MHRSKVGDVEPFADLLPPLPAAEYEALKADIAANGVVVPIVLDDDGWIIDGHHRFRIAEELGLGEPPSVQREGLTDAAKRDLALGLNLHRRHLSKAERAELHQRLRAQGMSTRQIAETTGASKGTVQNDLAGAQSCPPEVKGKDGKTYKASRLIDQGTLSRPDGALSPSAAHGGEESAATTSRVIRISSTLADLHALAELVASADIDKSLKNATKEERSAWAKQAQESLRKLGRFSRALRP